MKFLHIVSAAAFAVLAAACDNRPDINGAWTSTPTGISQEIAVADQATCVLTIDFDAPKGATGGSVMLSAVVDGTQPMPAGSLNGFDAPYEISVAATASISGKWSYEKPDDRDDDDIVIFLDNNTLQVNIDPNGVTYSQNLLTGAQQPAVDSLTTATVDRWRSDVRRAVTTQFFRYAKMDDIKIAGDILSAEVADRDITFHRSSAQ